MIRKLLKFKFLMKYIFVIFETIFIDRTISIMDIIKLNEKVKSQRIYF